jgi:hypothetical protein
LTAHENHLVEAGLGRAVNEQAGQHHAAPLPGSVALPRARYKAPKSHEAVQERAARMTAPKP